MPVPTDTCRVGGLWSEQSQYPCPGWKLPLVLQYESRLPLQSDHQGVAHRKCESHARRKIPRLMFHRSGASTIASSEFRAYSCGASELFLHFGSIRCAAKTKRKIFWIL